MILLVSHQQQFKSNLHNDDELAMSWIMKRPTEVVGLEAKRQAVKSNAAKERLELAQAMARRKAAE